MLKGTSETNKKTEYITIQKGQQLIQLYKKRQAKEQQNTTYIHI